MTNSRSLPPAPIRTPIVDDKGMVTQPWMKWLAVDLYQRVGKGDAITQAEIEELIYTPMPRRQAAPPPVTVIGFEDMPYVESPGAVVHRDHGESIRGIKTFQNQTNVTQVQFSVSNPPPAYSAGLMFWDDVNKTLSFHAGLEATCQIGQELYVPATNKTGVAMTAGQVVYINGAQGSQTTIALAKANAAATSDDTIGVVTEPIAVNGKGLITTFGLVHDLNTNAWLEGTILYLSAATAGALTSTKPTYPNRVLAVATVARQHQTQGELLVRVGAPTPDHVDLTGRSTVGSHPATAVTNTPSGTIVATTVQAAIDELGTEKLGADANLSYDGSNLVCLKPSAFGANPNYTQVEADGTICNHGNATTWNDWAFFPHDRTSGTGRPAWNAFLGNITAPQFLVNDYMDVGAQEMDHMWKEGSDCTVHIHFTSMTNVNATRGIKWEVEETHVLDGSGTQAWSAVQTFSAEATIPANTPAYTEFIQPMGTLTLTGGKIGGLIRLRVKRVAAVGTAPATAPFFSQVGIHREADTLGSRQVYTK